MLKVIFIGSNPSERSSVAVPFWINTGSRRVLNTWLNTIQDSGISFDELHFLNVSPNTTLNNKPLSSKEIKENIPNLKLSIEKINPTKIVALGRTAEKAIQIIGIPYFAMPHPSGLNRKLNDKNYIEQILLDLQEYLKK